MVSVCLPSDALLQHLPYYLVFSYLGHGVSLHSCPSKAQPLLLTLDDGYLLTATLPDFQLFLNLEPVQPSMSSSNYCFLTCIQVSQEAGRVVWYSHLRVFQFVMIHTVKSFRVVNEAEVDAFSGILLLFLWFSRFGSFISGSSAFSKSRLNIWKFSVYILLKPDLENFEHFFARMWK